MTTINNHIETYLDYYCSLIYSPEYAVLLKGAWGSGKTWFVRKYCDKLKKQGRRYLYVSLYGMTNIEEIEDAFFQQMHPILSSKGMAITGKILKGVLKSTLKIDWDNDKKEVITINSQLPDLNISDYFKDAENCILLFDDLERCALSMENVLGYINHFVEHQGLKVIIVANEDQIIEGEEGIKKGEKSYKHIKEKLIGKTFRVAPEVDDALSEFISQISGEFAQEFLKNNSEAVKEIYTIAGYENLRLLKQALWDFERLSMVLPEVVQKKDDIVRHLLQILLAFSFEIRRGRIQAPDIGKISKEYFSRLVSKDKEKTDLTEVIEKYDALDLSETLLTEKCWVDFLDKGIISQEAIAESLLKSRYFQDENTPNWVKLWHYVNLSDDEFEGLLRRVEAEFQTKKYKDIGIVKHVAGLLLRFSEIGLYEKDKTAILREAKEYIDDLKSRKKMVFSKGRSWDPDSYGGLGFAGTETPEFGQLINYIEDKAKEATIESLPDAGSELLKIMTADVNKFYRMVCLNNSADQIYYETPVFKYIKPAIFVETFLSMNPDNRRTAIFALDKRYEFDEINKRLIEEIAWLEEVRNIMIKEQEKRVGKVSGYILKSTIEHYMDKFLKKLEKANKLLQASRD